MTYEYIIWIATTAYGLHMIEETICDWHGSVRPVLKLNAERSEFYMVNAFVIVCRHPDRPHAGQFLLCRRCGMVAKTEDEPVAAVTAQRGQRFGFALRQHIFELTGVCKPCPG